MFRHSRSQRVPVSLLAVGTLVVALVAGATVGSPAASAAALVYYAPQFGAASDGPAYYGDYAAATQPTVVCAGEALTGIEGNQAVFPPGDPNYGRPAWLTGADAHCSPVLGGASVTVGSPDHPSPGGVNGFRSTVNPMNGDCPSGSVVTGFQGRDGSLIDQLQMLCTPVNSDGTLAKDESGQEVTTPAPFVGSVDGGLPRAPVYCPTAQVAVGIYGKAGQDLNAFGLECASMTFLSAPAQPTNTAWPFARRVDASSTTSDQSIDVPGEQLWFAFPVQPDSDVSVSLTGMTANLDLAVFRDISSAFNALTSTADLTHLSAEFAGDAYAPSVFSPSVFSPSVFSPSVFSPSVFSPSVFSPSVFSPSVFSPSVFSPSVFSPSVFSPSVFSPSVFSPSVFSPSVFSGGTPDPSSLASAFSSAQVRSLIAVSANDGLADEHVASPTWNNTGYYFVRVSGAISPFSLTVNTTGGPCNGITLQNHTSDQTLSGAPGPQTVILTDYNRMSGSTSALASAVSTFAGQVNGAVVNLDNSPKVVALNTQADQYAACPYAKNLVAQAIRDIVNSYRGDNLKYVVVVGDDHAIPFFRYPDTSGLGPEEGYYPPVADSSASQASLRNDDYLSQDAYGSQLDLTLKGVTLPVPDLAVGRLVETPDEITASLQRFATTRVIQPRSTLATGYDFLADAANNVADNFSAADAGGTNQRMIQAQGDPTSTSWTATDLKHAFLDQRHDVTFLAGHFSANSALAADFSTSLLTTDLQASTTDMANTLVFSAGCHSGYNIVNGDGVPGITQGLDWAEAFAQKGATLVAGTGYQYGDTDFVAYSEKLYGNFAHDLRYGTGPVAVGTALAEAKQDYLGDLTTVAGIDEKALLEATLFGLPMQGVDFPSGRLPRPTSSGGVNPSAVTTGPGSQLGLQTADFSASPTLTPSGPISLDNTAGGTVTAHYYTGPAGTSNFPYAPTLPLASYDVGVAGEVLRGAALLSGHYTDTDGITPLVSAATTDQSAAHGGFPSPFFYPTQIGTRNYYPDLTGLGGTKFLLTPVQYRSDGSTAGTDTERRYTGVTYRLYYSNNIKHFAVENHPDLSNVPGLAGPPTVDGITATPSADGSSIDVSAHVVGDPSAGIQDVWVTYTGEPGSDLHGSWQSVDLTQGQTDSTLWTGSFPITPGQADSARFMVQAYTGTGVGSVNDNSGLYFGGHVDSGNLPPSAATTLTVTDAPPATADYGDTASVAAVLKDGSGAPVPGKSVYFSVGTAGVGAITDSNGRASATMQLTAPPGRYPVIAAFAGDGSLSGSTATAGSVTISKRPTSLTLARAPDGSFTATLKDKTNTPLSLQTVTLVQQDSSGTVASATSATTGGDGTARFVLALAPAAGSTLTAYFGNAATPAVPVPPSTQRAFSDQSSAIYQASTSSVLNPGAQVMLADSSTNNSTDFGTSVKFTATIGSPSGAVAPTGSVQWAVDGTVVQTVPLTGTANSAALSVSVLLPTYVSGRHQITATYTGDSHYVPTTGSIYHTVTCANRLVNTTLNKSINATGSSYCVIGSTVTGAISSGKGTAIAVMNSTTAPGAFSASSSNQVMVCGSTIGGALSVSSDTKPVIIGDTNPALLCSPSTIKGTLSLSALSGGVRALGNTITGSVLVSKLSGPGPYGLPSAWQTKSA